MTPVILLTDGFIANGTQPWRIPDLNDWPEIKVPRVTKDMKDWHPYMRDLDKLSRYWAAPGIPGFEHPLGGLEKDYDSGDVSHNPENHQKMVNVRQEKVDRVANYIPELEILGDADSDVLVVGWGGTYGHLFTAFVITSYSIHYTKLYEPLLKCVMGLLII